MRIAETLRAAFVIARRDFRATVMSKSFLFFLLAPFFPLGVGVLFANLGHKIEREAAAPVLAVSLSPDELPYFRRAHGLLKPLLSRDERPPLELEIIPQGPDRDALRDRVIHRPDRPVVGILDGTLEQARFTGAVEQEGPTTWAVTTLVEEARRLRAIGDERRAIGPPIRLELLTSSSRTLERGREITARAGQALQFLLTLLLAGMLLSQLVEEKSNKVIEVLAAAVPIDAIFLGKLFAMLSVSLVGLAVWSSVIGFGVATWLPGGLSMLPPPAVGWPMFVILGLLYFMMSYLLLGAAFLGIGAQATTVREVQTLSMPVTMSQMLIFALCTAAVGKPNSQEGITAALVPFSSPFAMVARAAEQPTLWTHAAALAWQAMWVVIILKVSAGFFRRTVLKSGPAPSRWWKRRRT